jgi:hypothetical protein
MAEFDRFTTDEWTIAFPSDWIDRPGDDGALYFESPAGDKGFYVSLWAISDKESRGSRTLVEAFQATDLRSFLPPDEGWTVMAHRFEGDDSAADGYWEGLNADRNYWISGKQIASGKHVLRATFHDYNSSDAAASSTYFTAIIGSLELRAA